MSLGHKKGKILWFDGVSGEGLVLADEGKVYFLHKSALPLPTPTIENNTEIEFTVYENATQELVEEVFFTGEIT